MKAPAQTIATTILLFVPALSPLTAIATQYRIVDLGDLPGGRDWSTALKINNLGQVVGVSGVSFGGCCPVDRPGGSGGHTFLWQTNTGLIDLGDLPDGEDISYPADINASGIIAGGSTADSWRPFRWTSGNGMVNLGAASDGFPYCAVEGLNDQGSIAMVSWNWYGPPANVYLYSDGNWSSIGDLTNGVGAVWAQGINNANQIAGYAQTTAGNRAFIWTPGVGMNPLLPLAEYQDSFAYAINHAGYVAGASSEPNGVSHATLWVPGDPTPLDLTPPGSQTNSSFARGLNGMGQVVGASGGTDFYSRATRAFVWEQASGIIDLNSCIIESSGWACLEAANAINDKGEIVGHGSLTNGVRHAFILYPLLSTPPSRSVWDVQQDWSDLHNPNGPWCYREGTNPLPHVDAWENASNQTFPGLAQPAWAWAETATNRLPAWFKSTVQGRDPEQGAPLDWKLGDIVTCAADGENGQGNGTANVIWIAPTNLVVDISGSLWLGRNIDRAVHWQLLLNDALLAANDLDSTDSYSRTDPQPLTSGQTTPGNLRNVALSAGAVLRLQIEKTSLYGEYVGVALRVAVAGVLPTPFISATSLTQSNITLHVEEVSEYATNTVEWADSILSPVWTNAPLQVLPGRSVADWSAPLASGVVQRFYRVRATR